MWFAKDLNNILSPTVVRQILFHGIPDAFLNLSQG